MTDCHLEGPLTEMQAHHSTGEESTRDSQTRVTIDIVPDVALLTIFDFYIYSAGMAAWYTLVHVCQKWRSVVFGSPLRLNLRLYSTISTPVTELLNVWPPLLPIVVWTYDDAWSVDNIIAALEHNHRISRIELVNLSSSNLEDVSKAMQQPFPSLTRLRLDADGMTPPGIPASILGGSAPRLQELYLGYISFPGLPKLLLSATHLVRLDLRFIPNSGYISPVAMVTALSALTRLEILRIDFDSLYSSPQYHPDQNSPPLPTRALLPVLATFQFEGISEYLGDLVAWIDAPLLNYFRMTFYHGDISDTPQLTQFITRTPNFKTYNKAHLDFSRRGILVIFPQTSNAALKLRISCGQLEQLSSLAQVFSSSFFPQALIPTVEHLYIYGDLERQEDVEDGQWLDLLHPFTAVKGLHTTRRFASSIAATLQELAGESSSDVLPALQAIYLEEPLLLGPIIFEVEETGQRFSHPITVSGSRWAIGGYEFAYESDDDIDSV